MCTGKTSGQMLRTQYETFVLCAVQVIGTSLGTQEVVFFMCFMY